MNLLRALPLILACAVTFPVNAETSQSKDYYIPPESITKELSISSFNLAFSINNCFFFIIII